MINDESLSKEAKTLLIKNRHLLLYREIKAK